MDPIKTKQVLLLIITTTILLYLILTMIMRIIVAVIIPNKDGRFDRRQGRNITDVQTSNRSLETLTTAYCMAIRFSTANYRYNNPSK